MLSPELLVHQAKEFHHKGHFQEALAARRPGAGASAGHFEALYNRGILLWEWERDQEALTSLEQAIAVRRDHAATWNNRGNVLRRLKRSAEALASFDKALALRPDFANAIYNRANVLLLDMKRAEEALPAYDKALAFNPGFAEAWNNRGNALCSLGRFDEALASYDQALALRPDFTQAMNCRSQALLESGRSDEAIAGFIRSAELAYGTEQSPLAGRGASSPHKLRHDREQHDYQAGIKASARPGSRVQGPAVTPGNTAAAEQWRTKKPQIAVIDNLLTPEALEGLRSFCLEAPVWRRPYENGYLGAFPEHGFACPLLAQIAEELRDAFPGDLPRSSAALHVGFQI